MSMQRNTVQKTLIREALNSLCHPTAEEVYNYVHSKQPSISKATLYRNLKIMNEDGNVLKIDTAGAARYDNTVDVHFHGKCKVCNRIFDIDVDSSVIGDIREKVKDDHGFNIEDQELIFKGICPSCNKEENK